MNDKTISFRLPAALYAALKTAARQEGRPTQNYMRRVLSRAVGWVAPNRQNPVQARSGIDPPENG